MTFLSLIYSKTLDIPTTNSTSQSCIFRLAMPSCTNLIKMAALKYLDCTLKAIRLLELL